MSDEQENVGAETPSDTVETPETPSSETPAAETAAEQKVGDACTCPDGRPGTLQPGEGEGAPLVCIPNEG